LGFWVKGSGFRVWVEFRAYLEEGEPSRDDCPEIGDLHPVLSRRVVVGTCFRVQGSGFRVQGSGFRVQGSGFRMLGVGCTDEHLPFRARGHGGVDWEVELDGLVQRLVRGLDLDDPTCRHADFPVGRPGLGLKV
jgi:hypothetical protein